MRDPPNATYKAETSIFSYSVPRPGRANHLSAYLLTFSFLFFYLFDFQAETSMVISTYC
jgi:hypothetical protein